MASCKFAGGKCHGGGEVAGLLRHSDCTEDNRARVKEAKEAEGEYCNIDTARSHLNYNIDVETGKAVEPIPYSEMWKKYKDREREVEALPSNTNKRKDKVTGQFIEIPFPMALSGDDRQEDGKKWAENVTRILQKKYGKENIVAVCVHADEVHEYLDVRNNMFRESRRHIHALGVTEHDGSWNGKWFSKQSNMTSINREVEKMTQSEFGCSFMTGEKYKSRKSIQELKAESAVEETKLAILNRKKEYSDMLEKQTQLRQEIEQLEEQKKVSIAELKDLTKQKSDVEDEIERINIQSDRIDDRTRQLEALEQQSITMYREARDLVDDMEEQYKAMNDTLLSIRDDDYSRKAFLEGRKIKDKDTGETITEEEFYQRCSSKKKKEQDEKAEEAIKRAREEAEKRIRDFKEKHEERIKQAEEVERAMTSVQLYSLISPPSL